MTLPQVVKNQTPKIQSIKEIITHKRNNKNKTKFIRSNQKHLGGKCLKWVKCLCYFMFLNVGNHMMKSNLKLKRMGDWSLIFMNCLLIR